MVRVRADWIRRQANKELDSYLHQRVWHWTVRRNYALAADYAIRILNRHPKDPLGLLLGEVAAAHTNQEVFAEKCREAQRRLCFRKDVYTALDLLPSMASIGTETTSGPRPEDVKALLDELRAENAARVQSRSVTTEIEDEQIHVTESETIADTQTAVRRGALRASPGEPLCEVLAPKGCVYGRGLYATHRIAARSPILIDEPLLVQRMDENRCAHCLAPLHGTGGTPSGHGSRQGGAEGTEVPCPHCADETYCSRVCQEAAWQQYHACCCRSVNPRFAEWLAAMKDALYSADRTETVSDSASQSRAALSCMAVSKICAMATVQSVHPLALPGVRGLRGVADYEPTTALSEIGALAVTLSATLHQPFLYMEEVLSLFALLQTNEFFLPGGLAVYPLFSLLNHSCDPNCAIVTASQNAKDGAKRVLTALRDIRDGEQLFIDYNSHLTSKLAYEQRKALCAERHFECFCAKCVRRE